MLRVLVAVALILVSSFSGFASETLLPIPVQSAGKWSSVELINEHGESVIGSLESARLSSEGISAVKIGGMWGYVDVAGHVIIRPKYRMAFDFHDGRARVMNADGRYGFVSATGEEIVKPDYFDASDFSEGVAAVVTGTSRNPRGGYIDRAGNVIIPLQYHVVNPFSEGLALVRDMDGANPRFIDRNGRVALTVNAQIVGPFVDGCARVVAEGHTRYIAKDGREVGDRNFEKGEDFSEGLAPVLSDGKWGYLRPDGTFAIKPMYLHHEDDFSRAFRDGIAIVRTARGRILIDKEARELFRVPNDYTVSPFHGGYAYFVQKDLVGSVIRVGYLGRDAKTAFERTAQASAPPR